MAGAGGQARTQGDEVRRVVPVVAVVVAVLAALTDRSTTGNVLLGLIPVVALGAWTYAPRIPLLAVSVAVIAPVVLAQRSGGLEPLLFEASLLAFVVGCWSRSRLGAIGLGLLVASSPVLVAVVQDPAQITVGVWILGIAFPWVIARALVRQEQLSSQLEETRRELAEQALLAERRRIARDVHDFVGHGLAAVMLQVTSARHVLRRDPDSAEEALLAAEEVGRRSMQELRRTVAVLRSDDEAGVAAPLPSAAEIPALVDTARAGGLAVDSRVRGDLSLIGAGVGVAVYRIAQEALANAARHAPAARTVVTLELADGRVSLVADTSGPIARPTADPDRPHFGLIGMRERATALGGEFEAGPTVDGWRVSCRVPLEAAGEPSAEGER